MKTNIEALTKLVDKIFGDIVDNLDYLAGDERDLSIDIKNMLRTCALLNIAITNTCANALIDSGLKEDRSDICTDLYHELNFLCEHYLSNERSKNDKSAHH